MMSHRTAASGPVERLPVDARSPWWGEHRSRYRFAQRLIAGGRVLDFASGSGFGSAMLAANEHCWVVGCDASVDAAIGARTLASTRVAFLSTDGTALPFRSETFDAVVSFETLEHIAADQQFLAELRRVLRPSGLLVLSTPNAEITERYPRNPFHVREYRATELRELLEREFRDVEIHGQNLARRHRIAPFLPGHDTAKGVLANARLLVWKIGNRLPFSVKDSAARLLLGRGFYPTEDDFLFEPEFDSAHVLVATCRR